VLTTAGEVAVAEQVTGFAGDEGGVVLEELTPSGALDRSFGQGGQILLPGPLSPDFKGSADLADGPGGDIVVMVKNLVYAATAQTATVLRYTASGQRDPAFAPAAVSHENFTAWSLFVTPGGEVLVDGATASKAPALLALTPTGALDSSFGVKGTASLTGKGFLYAAALAPDGDILAAGESGNEPSNLLIARFSASGAPDAGFDHAGATAPPGTSSLGGTYAFSLSARPGGGAFVLGELVSTPDGFGPGPPDRQVLVV